MHPEIDRYAHLESAIHRWDPRWKLASLAVLLGVFAIGPAAAQRATWHRDVPHALACLAMSLALVQISRIPLAFALRRILPAGLFLVAFLVFYPLGIGGEGASAGHFTYSPARGLAAGCIAIRAVAIILLVFPLFGTSRFDVTVKAIRALKVPAPLVQLTAFTYRYIYVYADELRRLRIALRARGFRLRPSRHALRTAGNSLGMLLVRSVERTERIQAAMISRGYSGTFRTFDEFSVRAADLLKSAAVLAASAVLLVLRFAR